MSRVRPLLRLAGVTGIGAAVVAAGPVAMPQRDLSTGAERTAAAAGPTTRLVGAAALICPGLAVPSAAGNGPAAAQRRATLRVAAPPPALTAATAPAAPTGPNAPTGPTSDVPPTAHTLSTEPAGLRLVADADRARRYEARVAGPDAVSVRASGDMAAGLVATQSTLTTKGDLRGLTSAACSRPSPTSWLVGGGGEPGRRGRLVLVNPAASPVDVLVSVLSADGPVAAGPGSTVAIAGRSRAVLLLDALVPGVRSPVVHVRASGGAVTATLHDLRLAGTTPMGTDTVPPAAEPARRALVPGIRVPGAGRGRALLRLGVPGEDEAVGRLRLLGPSGPVDPPGGSAVRVRAGGTLDVDLSALPAGSYGAEVTADVPVVAGAMVARTAVGTGPADLAWLASVPPLRGLTGTDVRSGGPWSTVLLLSAPRRAATVDLTTVDTGGRQRTRTLRVPAGTTTTTPMGATTSAWVRAVPGSGDVGAATTTTYAHPAGLLVTASALADLPVSEQVPVLRPAP